MATVRAHLANVVQTDASLNFSSTEQSQNKSLMISATEATMQSFLVPEDDDVPLKDRCKRVNDIVAREGKQNVILISIHANAFGNGKEWTSPSGWSVYTSKGQTKADDLAEQLAKAAIKNLPQMKMRAEKSDGDLDYEENFYILKHTACPAVLTEKGFYTNKEDLAILESREGRRAITDLHVEGIVEHLTK